MLVSEMKNQFKTVVLLGGLAGLLVGLGFYFGGRGGATIALGFAALLNLGAYWFSDKIALKMSRARPVTESEAPRIYAMLRNLSQSAQMPVPRLFMIPSEQPNAFATGRSPEKAVVALTQGIVGALTPDELEGVIAHELAHIRNRDILIASVAATIAGAISWMGAMARWGALLGGGRDSRNPISFAAILVATMVAALGAIILQLAISRSREFYADATGARISGRPEALASALQKIDSYVKRMPMKVNAASEALYIVNPLRGGRLRGLFSTHPPTEERVRRLERLIGRV
jgi:heat shock protein HtpX